MSKITDDIIHANTEPAWKMDMPDYNPDGTANPKGDAAYWRERAEEAEARAAALRAELAAANEDAEARAERLQAAVDRLMAYRRDNTLNFQLEKFDDYLRALEAELKGGEE